MTSSSRGNRSQLALPPRLLPATHTHTLCIRETSRPSLRIRLVCRPSNYTPEIDRLQNYIVSVSYLFFLTSLFSRISSATARDSLRETLRHRVFMDLICFNDIRGIRKSTDVNCFREFADRCILE